MVIICRVCNQSNKVGLQITMFQIYFLQSVAGRHVSSFEPLTSAANESNDIPNDSDPLPLPSPIQRERSTEGKSYAAAVISNIPPATPRSIQREVSSSSIALTDGGTVPPLNRHPTVSSVTTSHMTRESSDDAMVVLSVANHDALKLYNYSLSCATAASRKDISIEFDEIMKVNSYGAFLKRIRLSYSPVDVTKMLRSAALKSKASKYHNYPFYGHVNASQLSGLDEMNLSKDMFCNLSWEQLEQMANNNAVFDIEDEERQHRILSKTRELINSASSDTASVSSDRLRIRHQPRVSNAGPRPPAPARPASQQVNWARNTAPPSLPSRNQSAHSAPQHFSNRGRGDHSGSAPAHANSDRMRHNPGGFGSSGGKRSDGTAGNNGATAGSRLPVGALSESSPWIDVTRTSNK
jgi:hypothetical protein